MWSLLEMGSDTWQSWLTGSLPTICREVLLLPLSFTQMVAKYKHVCYLLFRREYSSEITSECFAKLLGSCNCLLIACHDILTNKNYKGNTCYQTTEFNSKNITAEMLSICNLYLNSRSYQDSNGYSL